MRYEVYRRLTLFGRRWFWRLKADNNEIIAQGETNGYHNKADCLHGVDLVRSSAYVPVKVLEG